MFERGISALVVRAVVDAGKTIQSYPEDQPYPSRLVLGWDENRPIHVVVADNEADAEIIVITTYEPDPHRGESGFEKRRVS